MKSLKNTFNPLAKVLAILFLFSSFSVVASHFRYGTVRYQILSETGVGPAKQTVVQFTFNQAWRGDAFGAFPSVGTVYPAGSLGDMYWDFGDGSNSYWAFTVTATNVVDNWIAGTGTLTHTYTGNVDVLAFWTTCCRIGNLSGGNANGNMRIESLVTLSQTNNSSPLSNLPPIVNVPAGAAAYAFNLNGIDPNGDVLSYALSTTAQSALSVASPSFYTSVNSSTGVVTLNTTVGVVNGELYAIQFMITDARGSRIPLDFIMRITSAAPNNPPTFIAPTPANNSTINATVGVPMSFTIAASDADVADVVTLNSSGVPVGAVFTPGPAANPVSTLFSWTPLLADVGSHSISFSATDNNAGQALTNVNISVTNGGNPCLPAPTITITPTGLHANPWGNGGANDPYTFYYALTNTKRLNATIVGGVGPYTYSWTSSGGVATLMPRAYYPATSIDLFEPTVPVVVTLTITDVNTNCQYSGSISIGWSGDYACLKVGNTWYIKVCQSGVTTCVPWTVGKQMLLANPPTATLGACPPKTDVTTRVTNFNVYPNPSNGLVTFEMPIEKNTKGNIEVLDVNGRALYVESVDMAEGVFYHTIDLSALPNGIYVVRLSTDNEFATERIQIIR